MPPLNAPALLFSLPDVSSTVWTIVGIGLVIFVHELGHFLCARWVGVKVEIFSLGFGPRLVGWTRGGTDYRISLVPVGGYVKMAGDQPAEGTGAPDELLSRTPGERALIFSGGVLMNVLFALVVFPLVFHAGVPLVRPAVGAVEPGGPAWRAGLREGDEILEVDGREVLGFSDVALEVALGDPDGQEFLVRRADGRVERVQVRPEYSPEAGTLVVGIGRPTNYEVKVRPGGPAERAGLRDGDRLTAIEGREIDAVTLRILDLDQPDPAHVSVRRVERELSFTIDPDWRTLEDQRAIGVRTPENRILAFRGVFSDTASHPLRVGDRLQRIGGTAVFDALDARDAASVVPDDVSSVPVEVLRGAEPLRFDLPPLLAQRIPNDVALGWRTPPGAPEEPGVPVRVTPGGAAAEAGLPDGAWVLSVNGEPVRSWSELRSAVRRAENGPVEIVALADGRQRRVVVTPKPPRVADYGFDIAFAEVVRRYPLDKAFVVGMRASLNLARQAYLTLRKMVSRQVSPDNLGGIVAIGHVSYQFAQAGLAKLFYFLALLSINLAVINLLPIPILDGGHLLFLLIEKVKGSPVSERYVGYAQVIGLVVILSLLVFVTYNDLRRVFGMP